MDEGAAECTLRARERSPPPDGVGLLVYVYNAISGDHLATFLADPHDSVAVVKTKIMELTGTAEWRQKLLIHDVVLEDGASLQSYNVPPTNEVRV